jgi:YbbR domain-containing protein
MLSNWKRFFTKNWGLKLISLILALFLWLTVIGEEKNKSEKALTVPLEIHNRPQHLILVERPPQTVDVIIRASNRTLPEISALNVHVVLDLSTASIAQSQYALNQNMVSLPAGAEVKEISPSLVNLKWEIRRDILVPVKADTHGQLPEGLRLTNTVCVPSKVMIYGPESKIKDDLIVKTSLIDLSQVQDSMEILTDLILPDPDLRLVDSGTKVQVRLVVEKKQTEEGTESPVEKKPPNKK